MKITVLSRKDLEAVLELPAVITGVSEVYRLKAEEKTVVWPLVGHDFNGKGFMDIRSGGVFGDVNVHGAKMLNNFPGNREKGLPNFSGLLMVFDSETGLPVGVMDASYVTCMRTGAAGAIGAQALARPDAETLLILGAGNQAVYQLAACVSLLPQLKQVLVADPLSYENAVRFAENCPSRIAGDLKIPCGHVTFTAVQDLAEAVGKAAIVITITPSRNPVIKKEWVKPGTHFSCIGADAPGKEEIDPEIFRSARVYCDDKPQCVRVGETEIPIKSGAIREEEIIGEIGELLAGKIQGRKSEEDITIFDATGLALLDLVTAKTAIRLAAAKGIGQVIEIA
ncbi:MAG: ornithine cyclodeaminase family protein [Clostridia bacterium]|nr:ornithine cyclodeaminase family protein [Clostridia bacterium]